MTSPHEPLNPPEPSSSSCPKCHNLLFLETRGFQRVIATIFCRSCNYYTSVEQLQTINTIDKKIHSIASRLSKDPDKIDSPPQLLLAKTTKRLYAQRDELYDTLNSPPPRIQKLQKPAPKTPPNADK
jgi:hypothetical protein